MNPQAALDMGLEDGDFVYVDANSADRPYVCWRPTDAAYHAYRCMVRVKFNPALPYGFTIMKHTGWIATPRTVRAHESRQDGRGTRFPTRLTPHSRARKRARRIPRAIGGLPGARTSDAARRTA